jgi:hypothetical protein
LEAERRPGGGAAVSARAIAIDRVKSEQKKRRLQDFLEVLVIQFGRP